jgi:hypothetical protein
MSRDLVGTKTVNSIEELQSILGKFTPDCCYFGRWAHKVSGLVTDLDRALPSPEGQMFGSECEIRWKQNAGGYEVLLLHCDRSVTEWGFDPVGNGWEVSQTPLAAHLYDSYETRFPQGFTSTAKIKFQQRYFQDAATKTVHFVAITLVS